jgi:hypothetical protein
MPGRSHATVQDSAGNEDGNDYWEFHGALLLKEL